jgi:hypothetical protein
MKLSTTFFGVLLVSVGFLLLAGEVVSNNPLFAQCTSFNPRIGLDPGRCVDTSNGPGCTTVQCVNLPSPDGSYRIDGGTSYQICGDPEAIGSCEVCQESSECAIRKDYLSDDCTGIPVETPVLKHTCDD